MKMRRLEGNLASDLHWSKRVFQESIHSPCGEIHNLWTLLSECSND